MASRLPLALIEEIFSRLPIKTLIRFRCLSKSWRATIGSQEFIKNYLKNSSHHNLILGNFNGSSDLVVDEVYFYSADYDFFLETDRAVFNELSLPVRSRIDLETDILGSCNGLLCVLSLWDDRPILWNPSTREHPILLCALEFRCPFTGGTWYTNYGFGDDSVGDDYKVVAIPVIYGKDDQLAIGALHWVVKESSKSNSDKLIAAFDLGTEEFKLLQQPEYFDRHCDMRLGILEGCLSLICEYYKSHFDIWVMAEYGVQKSWTNLVSIKICDLSTNCRLSTSYPQAVKPIAYSKCSRRVLLGQANQLLLWYDIESISITYPVMQVTGAEQFFELGMFLQSLVKAQQ
ncbi:F-box protein CPR1-like [Coffea arabica]|uniref:F-box protein CPR1-like n=1 Tax=Coffea arabica TaxID=13443 RepID=A0ABM4WQ79_COFAR